MNEFPKIYRFFTEEKSLRLVLIGFVSALILGSVVFVSIDAYNNYQKKSRLDQKREKITKEIEFWQNTLNKYKNYRDAYFQIAALEYQLKDFEKSKYYLQKTLTLDPNFQEARRLERLLR